LESLNLNKKGEPSQLATTMPLTTINSFVARLAIF